MSGCNGAQAQNCLVCKRNAQPWLNGLVFVCKLIRCVFKSLCSHLIAFLLYSNSSITNQVQISNVFFNNYFATIAEKTKENINPLHKHFFDFLKNWHQNSFFLSPTNKSETQNIIPSLDSNKSVGPNSIHIKILKLVKNNISSQLADVFNISFSTVIFPTILKIAKLSLYVKKTLNWSFQTIDQFHYYPILKKY